MEVKSRETLLKVNFRQIKTGKIEEHHQENQEKAQ
jgi:hypothetical protein